MIDANEYEVPDGTLQVISNISHFSQKCNLGNLTHQNFLWNDKN